MWHDYYRLINELQWRQRELFSREWELAFADAAEAARLSEARREREREQAETAAVRNACFFMGLDDSFIPGE